METLLIILLVLWLLGAFVVPVGPFVHVILVVFLVVFLVNYFKGR